MKNIFVFATAFIAMFFAVFYAMAETTTTLLATTTTALPNVLPVDLVSPVPTQDFIEFLIKSLGGMKGASALAIAGIVVQILIKLLNTDFGGQLFSKIPGSYKLIVVNGLGLICGVISLMLSGLTLGAALVHSMTLNLFMVWANQIYKQFIVKSN